MKKGLLKLSILFIGIFCFIAPKTVFADGEVLVSTLEELSAAVANGGDIKLDEDITINSDLGKAYLSIAKDTNLDLNGYTLTLDGKFILLAADVTIKDSSDGKTGLITSTSETISNNARMIWVGGSSTIAGNLTFLSGKMAATDNKAAVYVRNGEFIMEDGELSAASNTVSVSSGASMNLKGGLIKSNTYPIYSNGDLTITDGKVEASDTTGKFGAAIYNNGKLVINGGEIYSEIDTTIYNYENATITLNDGTIKTDAPLSSGNFGINLAKSNKAIINGGKILVPNGYGIAAFKDSEVEFNDGEIESYYFGLTGNGSAAESGAKFYINGGTITSANAAALYLPQIDGETVITGGDLTGVTGIEIRAGSPKITGGTFTATATEFSSGPNGNGTTTAGSAVAVAQHTTMQPIDVTIEGGTFKGLYALSETNPQNNNSDSLEKVEISIKDGTFTTTDEKTIYSENFTKFITGGVYNVMPDLSYLEDNYTGYISNGKYIVDKKGSIKTENEKIIVKKGASVETGVSITGCDNDYSSIDVDDEDIASVSNGKINGLEIGETTLTVNLNDINNTTKELSVVVYYIEEDEEIKSNDNYLTDIIEDIISGETEIDGVSEETIEKVKSAIEDNKVIIATVDVNDNDEISDEDLELSKEVMEKDEVAVMSYDINVLLTTDEEVLGKVTELKKEIKITIDLPENLPKVKENYTREYYFIRIHDNKVTKLKAKVVDGKLEFSSDKFSTYILTYNDKPTVTVTSANPNTGDHITKYFVLALISLISIIICKKMKNTCKNH